jgi:VCBS repeat-containing protein
MQLAIPRDRAFALLNDAGGRFALAGGTFVVAGAVDLEVAQSYQITERVTDATDADNFAGLTYRLWGADAALFNIDPETGAVAFKVTSDVEASADADCNNIYDKVMTTSDDNNTTNQAVTIAVTSQNDNAAVFASDTFASFVENDFGLVHDAEATDADDFVAPTCSLLGADTDLFDVDPGPGEIGKFQPTIPAPT